MQVRRRRACILQAWHPCYDLRVNTPQIADAVCERCGGRGWILEEDGGAGTAIACECQAESIVPRLLRLAGIPARYHDCSLESFTTDAPDPGHRDQLLAAKTRSRRYVDDFLTEEGRFTEQGLLFTGPTGVGKTHLAVATLAQLIQRYRVHALFTDCTALIHRLQSTFEPRSNRGKREVLDPILGAEVLLVDDLGAQKPSEWVSEILYLIFNERYSARLPTLVTTNLRLERDEDEEPSALGAVYASASEPRPRRRLARESVYTRLPASLVSRLYEMTRTIRIEAGDFRREIKSH